MKALDFRAFEQATWEVILPNGTAIHLTAPTEELIETMSVNLPQLQEVFNTRREMPPQEDLKAFMERQEMLRKKSYDLMAQFVSCNTEGLTITGEELRTVYGCKPVYIAAFFMQYGEFMDEIKNAKN